MSDIPTIQSHADVVVFFEDRARVTRLATLSLEPGINRVRISGISLLVDDSSLTIRPRADVRVITARVHRNVNEVPNATREEIEALEERVRRAVSASNRLNTRAMRIRNQKDRLQTLEDAYLNDVRNLNCDTEIEATLAAYDEPLTTMIEKLDALEPELRDAQREKKRAHALLENARTMHPEFNASVDVQFEADKAIEIECEVSYQLPCALWRPSHIARLDRGTSSVRFTNSATVWQLTGEVWENVLCRFSTARPAQASSPPLLTEDVISARTKDREERKEVNVEAREVDINDTGADGARAIDDMPGVDDGGEPLNLEALERVTIPSNGEPFRIDIGVEEVDVEAELVAFPEFSQVPHLRARGTWSAPYPMLAGPIHLMRENVFAGRALAQFVSSGDVFEIGFGIDSNISVKRQQDIDHDQTMLTKRTTILRSVRFFVSNLSGDTVRLKVIERTPVSEIEDVQIKKFKGANPDQDGICTFDLELQPRETTRHEFSYQITHPKNVNLRF